jgi:hypothetical protein
MSCICSLFATGSCHASPRKSVNCAPTLSSKGHQDAEVSRDTITFYNDLQNQSDPDHWPGKCAFSVKVSGTERCMTLAYQRTSLRNEATREFTRQAKHLMDTQVM